MAEQDQNRARIDAALNRARARWLTSAMVNAGGRWAVLPAAVVALLAIALALAGVHTLAWLLPLCLLGVAGAVVSLLLTRRAYAQPAAPAYAQPAPVVVQRPRHNGFDGGFSPRRRHGGFGQQVGFQQPQSCFTQEEVTIDRFGNRSSSLRTICR